MAAEEESKGGTKAEELAREESDLFDHLARAARCPLGKGRSARRARGLVITRRRGLFHRAVRGGLLGICLLGMPRRST